MTGSLLSVASNCRLAGFGDLFLCVNVVNSFSRIIRCRQCASQRSTGSGRPPVDRSGVDFQVQLDVPRNAPEAFVNLESDGIYELNTTCLPDVLGLRARQLGTAVIRVMTGRHSRNVRALVPDGNVLDRGFHDVTLVDMDHVEGPDVPVVDLDILRLMWSLLVVSGMSDQQFELEQLRRTCKKRYRGTQSVPVHFVGR